jgi:hypothetical protein
VAPDAIYTLEGPTLRAARELSTRLGAPTLIVVDATRPRMTPIPEAHAWVAKVRTVVPRH